MLNGGFRLDVASTRITGDNASGVAIFSDRKVAYMNNYTENVWHSLSDAPFAIELMTGNNRNGLIIYGNNQLQQMPSYAANVWRSIPYAGFTIKAMAGNPSNGIVCIVGAGDIIEYCDDFNSGRWPILRGTL